MRGVEVTPCTGGRDAVEGNVVCCATDGAMLRGAGVTVVDRGMVITGCGLRGVETRVSRGGEV